MLTEQPERAVVFACADRNAIYNIPAAAASASGGRIQVMKLVEPSRQPASYYDGQPRWDEHTWPLYTSGSLSQLMLWLYPSGREDALILADGLLPPAIAHPILAVVPPLVAHSWWRKPAIKRYSNCGHQLPIPSEAEVLAMHQLCYPHLDERGVRRRVQLWGPIPSRVLGSVTDAEQRALWERARSVSLEDLMAVGHPEGPGRRRTIDNDSDAQLLLTERAAGQDAHAVPQAVRGSRLDATDADSDARSGFFYFRGKTTIASPALLRMVTQRIREQQLWKALFLVDITASVTGGALGPAALPGLRFTDTVLSLMEEGSEFDCRYLGTDKSGGPGVHQRPSCVKVDSGRGKDDAASATSSNLKPRPLSNRDGDVVGGKLQVLRSKRKDWSSAAELAAFRGAAGARTLLVPHDRHAAMADGLFWDADAGHHWPVNCSPALVLPWQGESLRAHDLVSTLRGLGWTAHDGFSALSGAEAVVPAATASGDAAECAAAFILHHETATVANPSGRGEHAATAPAATCFEGSDTATGPTSGNSTSKSAETQAASKHPSQAAAQAPSQAAPSPLKYFWAVPEDFFDRYWRSPGRVTDANEHLRVTDARAVTAQEHAALRRAEQYALCVPSALRVGAVLRVLEEHAVPMPEELVPKRRV